MSVGLVPELEGAVLEGGVLEGGVLEGVAEVSVLDS